MAFFDLPPEPKKSKPRPAKKAKKVRAPKRRPLTKSTKLHVKRPRRVVVPEKLFKSILVAGDWPGGPNRVAFKHRGKTYLPWIVLEHQVTARGPRDEVVEFVRKGSPLDS